MTKFRDWLTESGLAAMLWWKSRPGLVSSALSRQTFQRAAPPSRDRVTVGLAQMRMELVASADEYALHAYELTRAAVERGAQLVAFPEYTGAPLLGLLPGVRELASGRTMQDAINDLTGGAEVSVGDVFRAVAPAARKIHVDTFSTLARKFGIHLMAGSIILPGEDGKLYSYAHLFAPDGHSRSARSASSTCSRRRKAGLLPATSCMCSTCRLVAWRCRSAWITRFGRRRDWPT